MLHPTSGYSNREEWANSISHGIGAALSLIALVIVVVIAALHGDAYLIAACSVYGASLFLLHLFSTLYHSVRDLRWKSVFLTADHASIYLLIAGTYTPFCLGPLRGPVGWTLFGIIWGLAIIGIGREVLRPKRGSLISTLIYLAMGWLIFVFFLPLARAISTTSLLFLLGGGLLYSVGVLFYLWKGLRFHHAIWHLFVMAAAATQFIAVLSIIS